MSQQLVLECGALQSLAAIVAKANARSVFLVTGDTSFESSGAAAIVANSLGHCRVERLSGLGTNPTVAHVERGLAQWRAQPCDLMVAIGGGTAIDTAKLINAFANDATPVIERLSDPRIDRCAVPLVAAPTTAGSGSEATHFAVIYDGFQKHSIAHPDLRPDVALIDPLLTESMARSLTAVTGLDALCQGIESMWSVGATPASLAMAREAIALAFEHLPRAYSIGDRASREAMSRAAHLAGRAINITKTTASHALSYTLTSRFGVPHGHAVGLTIGSLMAYNYKVSRLDVTDPRGASAVRSRIDDICRQLGAGSVTDAHEKLTRLLESFALATHLGQLGITSQADLRLIVDDVNTERLANNPRQLETSDLERLITSIA